MRKTGYTLLILGFVWVTFFAVEATPVARAMIGQHRQKASAQKSYSREDVEVAFTEAANEFSIFVTPVFVGGLMMLVGGIILDKAGKRGSASKKP